MLARAVPAGGHRYPYSSTSCRGIRMREYVDPTCFPCGSGAMEIAIRKCIAPGTAGLAQAHPLTKLPATKQPSAGFGPVTALPTHSGVGPRTITSLRCQRFHCRVNDFVAVSITSLPCLLICCCVSGSVAVSSISLLCQWFRSLLVVPLLCHLVSMLSLLWPWFRCCVIYFSAVLIISLP